MSSTIGRPDLSPCPCVVYWAITSFQKKLSRASRRASVPTLPSFLTRCALLLMINDGGCSLDLSIADDGSRPWPDDGPGIVLAMLLDGNGSWPEDDPGIVLAS